MSTMLGDMLVRYRADISDLTSKVKSMKSDMSSVGPVAQQTGNSITSGFQGGLSGLLNFTSKIGMTIFGVKQLAQSAIGLGEALLEPNASMEQTQVGFDTLLGKGQKTQAFLKDLQSFADATPFEFPELSQDAEHMLAFGFNAKEIIPDLTAVGDAMSDMGKSNADIDSVVTVFGQMKAAGKVNAQDMMQLTSQGIPAWKILADSMHLSVAQVQDLSQKGLLPADQSIKALTGGMEKMFGGGMKAQAQTFNGQLSTLKDKASEAMRSFTGPLFDMAKQGLGKLGELVSSKSFQDFATSAGKNIGTVLGQIGAILKNPVIPSFLKLIEIGGNVVTFFRQNEGAMTALKVVALAIGGAVIASLVVGFYTWAVAAGAAAVATIAATWPILLIGAAVALVIVGIILAVKNWGAIMHWIQGVFGTVTHWIGDQFSRLGGFFHTIITGIGGAFSGLGSKVHSIWDGIVGVVKGAINLIIGGINQFIDFIDGIQIHIPAIGVGPIHTPAFDWNGVGIPHIPYLASGGIIQSSGLAFVHRDETVIPAGGGATTKPLGSTGQGITIIVEMDSVELTRKVMTTADRLVRLKLGSNGRAA